MKINNKYIKTIIYGLVAVVFVAIIIFGLERYNRYRKDNMLLSYDTKHKWDWYDYGHKIQIRYKKDGLAILRRVNMDKSYVFYCAKTDKYDLQYLVAFITPCKPKTEIKTWNKYSDGSPMILTCDEQGKSLEVGASLDIDNDPQNPSLNIKYNFNGFSVHEDLRLWDLSVLDRSIALKNSK